MSACGACEYTHYMHNHAHMGLDSLPTKRTATYQLREKLIW